MFIKNKKIKFTHTDCLLTAPYCLLAAATQPIQGLPPYLLSNPIYYRAANRVHGVPTSKSVFGKKCQVATSKKRQGWCSPGSLPIIS